MEKQEDKLLRAAFRELSKIPPKKNSAMNFDEIIDAISHEKIYDLIKFLHDVNIDFFYQDNYGTTLISSIFRHHFPTTTDLQDLFLLEQLGQKNIQRAFLDINVYHDLLLVFRLTSQSRGINFSSFCYCFFSFIDNADIKNSLQYKKFISSHNLFYESLFQLSLEHRTNFLDILEKNKNFFGNHIKKIIDTSFIYHLCLKNSTPKSEKILQEAYSLILNNDFKPEQALLSSSVKNIYLKGHICNYAIDSVSYKLFKQILVSQTIAITLLNYSVDGYYNFFESFILNNLSNIKHTTKIDLKLILFQRFIEEANSLIYMNIHPFFNINTKESIEQLFNSSISHMNVNQFSDDIRELSYELKIQPDSLQRLIGFLDKRYGFISKEDIIDVEDIKNSWKLFISNCSFI